MLFLRVWCYFSILFVVFAEWSSSMWSLIPSFSVSNITGWRGKVFHQSASLSILFLISWVLCNHTITTYKTDVLELGSGYSLTHLETQGSLCTNSHKLTRSFALISAPFSLLSLNDSHSLFIYSPFVRHLLCTKLSPMQHSDFRCRVDWYFPHGSFLILTIRTWVTSTWSSEYLTFL